MIKRLHLVVCVELTSTSAHWLAPTLPGQILFTTLSVTYRPDRSHIQSALA